MQEWTAIIYIFDFRSGPEVIDAFEAFERLPFDLCANHRSKIWSDGVVASTRRRRIGAIADVIRSHGANRIELECSFQDADAIADLHVQSINVSVDISPLNTLWISPRNGIPANRNDRQSQRHFASLEFALALDDIERYPTILSVEIGFECSRKANHISRLALLLHEWLAESKIPSSLVGHIDCFERNSAALISGPAPGLPMREYAKSDISLIGLHPVMFNKRPLVEDVGRRLKCLENVTPNRSEDPRQGAAVIWLPEDKVGDQHSHELIRELLVAPDNATESGDTDATKGRFRFGNSMFYTRERWNKLVGHTLDDETVAMQEIIHPKYAQALGVPDAMLLVRPMSKTNRDAFQLAVEQEVSRHQAVGTLLDRVLNAYRTVVNSSVLFYDERIAFAHVERACGQKTPP